MMNKLIDIITRNYLGLPTTPAEKAIYLAATTGVWVGMAYTLRKIMPYLEPYLEQAQENEEAAARETAAENDEYSDWGGSGMKQQHVQNHRQLLQIIDEKAKTKPSIYTREEYNQKILFLKRLLVAAKKKTGYVCNMMETSHERPGLPPKQIKGMFCQVDDNNRYRVDVWVEHMKLAAIRDGLTVEEIEHVENTFLAEA